MGKWITKTSWNSDRLELTFWGVYFVTVEKSWLKIKPGCRICRFNTMESRRILMKAFIKSQFDYCPFVLMCCNRSCNNCINHFYERALRIVYNDNSFSFEGLLRRDSQLIFIIETLTYQELNYTKLGTIFLVMSWINYLNNKINFAIFNHKQQDQLTLLVMAWKV